ncbi:uncharacterized protein [Miscanthus floridulus]|uniref:uncharacterized protein isoform X1 n=1 Tax=Miscanthus floridulus TaxID=154761 RepID=UPI003457A648
METIVFALDPSHRFLASPIRILCAATPPSAPLLPRAQLARRDSFRARESLPRAKPPSSARTQLPAAPMISRARRSSSSTKPTAPGPAPAPLAAGDSPARGRVASILFLIETTDRISMNGLRRPKASRGSGGQAAGAYDPARQARLATGAPQYVAAAVNGSSIFMHGVSHGTTDSLYPPGGFTNFLQHNSFLNNPCFSQVQENSHFVGATNSQHAVSPTVNASMHTSVVGSADKEPIDIDGDESPQPNRSEVRLNWTRKEDERLANTKAGRIIVPVAASAPVRHRRAVWASTRLSRAIAPGERAYVWDCRTAKPPGERAYRFTRAKT